MGDVFAIFGVPLSDVFARSPFHLFIRAVFLCPLRARFNAVHDWAVEHFGEDQLLDAVRTLRAGAYKQPMADDEGPRVAVASAPRSTGDHVSPEAIALVDAIAERALSFGWKHERLYGTGGKGSFDPQRGLVRFLKPSDRIGEVTAQSIEIIHPLPTEVRHRFYNPDADQPWVKKSTTTLKKTKIRCVLRVLVGAGWFGPAQHQGARGRPSAVRVP